jgi:hypothetical protein
VTARNIRDSAQLRERAIALRRAGKSVRQIKQILGPVGNRTLHDALRGEPPPEWTRRPNAKDDLRGQSPGAATARPGLRGDRRAAGRREEFGLPMGSRPSEAAESGLGRMRQARIRTNAPILERRASGPRGTTRGGQRGGRRKCRRPDRAREILIAGAVAYRCEGARNKPHRRVDRVTFANSDPELISFFLLFLDTAGIPRSSCSSWIPLGSHAQIWLSSCRSTGLPT